MRQNSRRRLMTTKIINVIRLLVKNLTLRCIYGAIYLGYICYGAPVWADSMIIGAARR